MKSQVMKLAASTMSLTVFLSILVGLAHSSQEQVLSKQQFSTVPRKVVGTATADDLSKNTHIKVHRAIIIYTQYIHFLKNKITTYTYKI